MEIEQTSLFFLHLKEKEFFILDRSGRACMHCPAGSSPAQKLLTCCLLASSILVHGGGSIVALCRVWSACKPRMRFCPQLLSIKNCICNSVHLLAKTAPHSMLPALG